MSMTERDKKVMLLLLPVLLLAGFWFLVLGPKRAEVSKLDTELATAEQKRDSAVGNAQALEGSRSSYAKDYATVVRLGKAVPSTLDMPSLLVQLDSAAKGTGIDFKSVKAGTRAAASGVAPPSGGSPESPPPVAAGGAQAQTTAGKTTEKANEASQTSDQANQASGADAPASGAAAPGGGQASSGAAGLDSVPLDFDFNGSYFELADFFHRMKRFVNVANEDIRVKGRLMTIDNLDFSAEDFPQIKATVTATVYLSPKAEGANAGGTPAGPQNGTTPSSAGTTPPAAGTTPPAGGTTPPAGGTTSPAAPAGAPAQ